MSKERNHWYGVTAKLAKFLSTMPNQFHASCNENKSKLYLKSVKILNKHTHKMGVNNFSAVAIAIYN